VAVRAEAKRLPVLSLAVTEPEDRVVAAAEAVAAVMYQAGDKAVQASLEDHPEDKP